MSIADNIKKIRLKYGLTQAELGEIAGVSDKAVSTWENGTAEPRMGAVQRIAEHFNISKGSIVDDSPSLPTVQLTASEHVLLDNYRKLDDDDKSQLDSFIGYLLSNDKYIKAGT